MKNYKVIRLFLLTIFFLASGLYIFAQEEAANYKTAIGLGLEMNMNSPENFAAGLALNFDYNLPFPSFAVGLNITGSNNFAGISVLELSGMFRWYFLNRDYKGLFAQANLGYNYSDIEGSPMALISELRGGVRLPLGNFYLEPYGRVGYPVVWGAGIAFGIRFQKKTKNNEVLTDELR